MTIRNKINTLIYFISFCLISFTVISCASKTVNPRLQKLEAQKEILDLNTQLNKLNISLEEELVKISGLVNGVKEANQESIKSADEAKNLTEELAKNPGDSRLASKVERAANRAAKDAKNAAKINARLEDANDNVKDYQNEIADTEKKLKELQSRVEFVPNQQ